MTDADGVTITQADLPADAPVVKVRGLGLMGAVSVTRVPAGNLDGDFPAVAFPRFSLFTGRENASPPPEEDEPRYEY